MIIGKIFRRGPSLGWSDGRWLSHVVIWAAEPTAWRDEWFRSNSSSSHAVWPGKAGHERRVSSVCCLEIFSKQTRAVLSPYLRQ